MGGKQLGFSDYEQTTIKKRTKKEKFLAEMDQVVPWQSLLDLIEVATIHRFAGIDLISDRLPDETMILAFRHLLEKQDLGQQFFETVKAHLKQMGMAIKQGTIIDATLISAPSSTKNKTGERDPERHQTKKGNQWYHRYAEGFAYGMKVHIGFDNHSGLIHSVETTSHNVHEITRAAQLLHWEEEVVYGDSGYQAIEKRA